MLRNVQILLEAVSDNVPVIICGFVVRAFTYGVMGCWINPSWWTH